MIVGFLLVLLAITLIGTKIMATIEEVTQQVADLIATVTAVDLKLDEIRTFIQGLQAGVPVTQEQLDQLHAALDAVKISALLCWWKLTNWMRKIGGPERAQT